MINLTNKEGLLSMIIELGSFEASNLFSRADFKLHEETIKRLEKNNLANEKVYFLDTSVPLLWMNAFKDGEPVEMVKFASTKSKMQKALKFYGVSK